MKRDGRMRACRMRRIYGGGGREKKNSDTLIFRSSADRGDVIRKTNRRTPLAAERCLCYGFSTVLDPSDLMFFIIRIPPPSRPYFSFPKTV